MSKENREHSRDFNNPKGVSGTLAEIGTEVPPYECSGLRFRIKPLRNVGTRLVNDHRYIVALRD
jgi:hypothetical protein